MTQRNSISQPFIHSRSLAGYFPMIRTRQEIIQLISDRPELNHVFQQWEARYQEEFLDFCTGIKGLKVLYDGIFKEIFNPETVPERLNDLLSFLLNRQVRIKIVLPNDSVRLGAESSLLYTDIIVQLEDGSLADIEIQKISYQFSGQRAACYSSDHLLRQYKRVRGTTGSYFNYRQIKNVYTIVFFETSPKEFHEFPNDYIHIFCQKSNTGLKLELLQEFVFIPLDIFRKNMDNRKIENKLDAWLSFLAFDDPDRIAELFTSYPEFKAMYQDVYDICRNVEEVMRMYSKELAELDRNTVKFMIDEMQAEIDQMKTKNAQLNAENETLKKKLSLLEKKQPLKSPRIHLIIYLRLLKCLCRPLDHLWIRHI